MDRRCRSIDASNKHHRIDRNQCNRQWTMSVEIQKWTMLTVLIVLAVDMYIAKLIVEVSMTEYMANDCLERFALTRKQWQ
jgi:hypothetical protein